MATNFKLERHFQSLEASTSHSTTCHLLCVCPRRNSRTTFGSSSAERKHFQTHAIPNKSASKSLEDQVERLAPQVATDEAYQECAAFLRELGLDNRAELARVMDIATNPKSIYSTFQGKNSQSVSTARKLKVDADLKTFVAFFEQQGLSKKEIVKIIVEHPPALCYPLQDRIQPFLTYLGSLGISSPANTILQRPSLLGLDGEKSLRQIVDYLQQNDYTPEQIEQLLCTSI